MVIDIVSTDSMDLENGFKGLNTRISTSLYQIASLLKACSLLLHMN
ncbi:MAG: hypothetical protein JWQ57_3606 [Mucilaginibacter sp.]|nr:hypothetical protein [Mucilaginibacter sp.]